MLKTIWSGLIILPWTVFCAFVSIIAAFFVPKGRGYHFIGRLWSWLILKVIGVKIVVKGLEHLDPKANYVFVCNHASAMDIPVVINAIPYQIRLVAKKELEKVFMLGWSLKFGDYILIDRDNRSKSKSSLDEAADKLKNGRSILMFAEGTRSVDGTIGSFKVGPFLLAINAQAKIVPVTLNFTQNIMEKDRLRVHAGTVEVIFSSPVDTAGKTDADRKQIVEVTHAAVVKNHRLS